MTASKRCVVTGQKCKVPVLLGMGANVAGNWGGPVATLQRALSEMELAGVHVLALSRLYGSKPMGPVAQPAYHNCAVAVDTHLPPRALLRRLKRLEFAAGRRAGVRWGPRPLDIDILDFKGRILASAGPGHQLKPLPLVLPHPHLQLRNFVLQPLLDIVPYWHHPRSGRTAAQMLKRLPGGSAGLIEVPWPSP